MANGYQTIPLSGSTDLEPGDLLGTYSLLILIPTSALQNINTEPLPTGAHALHDSIPVADDGLPPTEPTPLPKVPCPKLLQRLSRDQRTTFSDSGMGYSYTYVTLRSTSTVRAGSLRSSKTSDTSPASLPTSSPHPKPILARARSFRSRFPSPRTAPLCSPAPTGSTLSLPGRPMLYLTNTWPQASFGTRPLRTPAPWSPSPIRLVTSGSR